MNSYKNKTLIAAAFLGTMISAAGTADASSYSLTPTDTPGLDTITEYTYNATTGALTPQYYTMTLISPSTTGADAKYFKWSQDGSGNKILEYATNSSEADLTYNYTLNKTPDVRVKDSIKTAINNYLSTTHANYTLSTSKLTDKDMSLRIFNGVDAGTKYTQYYFTPADGEEDIAAFLAATGNQYFQEVGIGDDYIFDISGTHYTINTALIPDSSYTETTVGSKTQLGFYSKYFTEQNLANGKLTEALRRTDLTNTTFGSGDTNRYYKWTEDIEHNLLLTQTANPSEATITAIYHNYLDNQDGFSKAASVTTNGNASKYNSDGGAAFSNPNGTTTNINQVLYTNNTTTGTVSTNGTCRGWIGGAVHNAGTLTSVIADFVDNSFVADRVTTTDSSAKYRFYGGGALGNTGTINSLTGNFINNVLTASGTGPDYGGGGAIMNLVGGTISSVTGDFIDNHANITAIASGSKNADSHLTGGGAIYNLAKMDNLQGNYIGNYANISATSSGSLKADSTYSGGGAIYVYSGVLGNIAGDFINNYANVSAASTGTQTASSYASGGGAIYIRSEGTTGNVTGDFIGNYTNVSANASGSYSISQQSGGGAIFNNGGTMGNITGDFIANYAIISAVAGATGYDSDGSMSGGGAIYNNGTMGNITGNFLGNYVNISGSASGYGIAEFGISGGGAIYNSKNISYITGNFIDNYVNVSALASGSGEAKSYNSGGGAIIISTFCSIEKITGNFIGNHVNVSATSTGDEEAQPYSSGGGAIYNYSGTIGDIDADFTQNYAIISGVSSGSSLVNASGSGGGAIFNNKGVGNVTGKFIGNYANVSALSSGTEEADAEESGGGAIFNNDDIGKITGDFVGNYAVISAVAESTATYADATRSGGGAIYNYYGTMNDIEGDFIDNYALISASSAGDEYAESYSSGGGAIYNYYGPIGNIIGNFTGNYADISATTEAGATYAKPQQSGGGAIFNFDTIGDITGDFVRNHANVSAISAGSEEAKAILSGGGAIFNNQNADMGNISGDFIENYAYISATSNGTSFSDASRSGGGAIFNVTGDIGDIDGDFIGNYAVISAISSNSEDAKAYSTGGGAIYNYAGTIGNIDGNFTGNYAKISATSADSSKIDTSNSGGGAIYNNTGASIGDISGNFTGNYAQNVNGIVYGGAIYNAGTIGDVTGDFIGNYVQDGEGYGGAIYNTGTINLYDSSFKGNNATNGNGGAIYNNGGTLSVTANTKNIEFTNNNSTGTPAGTGYGIYNASGTVGLNAVGSNTLTVNDAILNAGTLNLNSAGQTGTITLKDVTGTTGSLAVSGGSVTADSISQNAVTVAAGKALTVGTLAATGGTANAGTLTITVSNSTAVTGAGTTIFAGSDTVNTGLVSQAAEIASGKQLTSTIENLGGTITNAGTLITTGTLNKTISGAGTTKINSTLTMGTSASIVGALDMNNGTLTLSDGTNTAYSVGSLLGSGNLAIDYGTTGADSIAITNSDSTPRTITLTTLNGLTTSDTVAATNILTGATDNITLDVSAALRAIYDTTVPTGSGYDADVIPAVVSWTDTFKNRYYDILSGKQLIVDNSTSNKTLAYDSVTNKVYDPTKDTPMGDTLKLINQDTTNSVKTFIAPSDGSTYTVTENLGATKGTLTITGVSGGSAETINLNNYTGFELGDSNSVLNLNDIVIGGSSTIATVTNSGAQINLNNATVNGVITGTVPYALSSTGTNTLNAAVQNATITNTGTLTSNADNFSNSGVINNGNLILKSGDLNADISGTGLTTFNGTVTVNSAVNNDVNISTYQQTPGVDLYSDVTVKNGKTFGNTSITVDNLNTLTMENANDLNVGVVNNGNLNLLSGTLSKNITTTSGLATTTIKGNVTNNATITQKTVNVGDGIIASSLLNTNSITADTINVTSADFIMDNGSSATTDDIFVSNGNLTIKDNANLAVTNNIQINTGNLNLETTALATTDLNFNKAVNGSNYDVNVTTTGNNAVVLNSAITGANNVNVNGILEINDGGTVNNAAGNGSVISLNTNSKLNINSNTGRVLNNDIQSLSGGEVNFNKNGATGTIELNNVISGVENINAENGTIQIGNASDNKTSTSSTLGTAVLNIKNNANAKVVTGANSYTVNNNIKGQSPLNVVELSGVAGTPGSATNRGTSFGFQNGVTFSDATLAIANGELRLPNESFVGNNAQIRMMSGSTLNAMDGVVTDYNSKIIFDNNSQVLVDVNAYTATSDRFLNAQQNAGDTVVITDINLLDLTQIVKDNTQINLADTMNIKKVSASSDLTSKTFTATTPLNNITATVSQDGIMTIEAQSTNDYPNTSPSAVVVPVAAQTGAYTVQLRSYDEAFHNMDMFMLMTERQRHVYKNRNKYAAADGGLIFNPTMSRQEQPEGYVRAYATIERVPLNNGPDVNNVSYGSFVGGDTPIIQMKNGWEGMYGAYIGYNGSHQTYDGISIWQNGGTIGMLGMLYKGNFFSGLTANVSATAGEANTRYGTDKFTMLMTGAASKTGYNFEFKDGRFVIQPSLLLSYTFVNTFDYTNAAGIRITSDPLNAIQIEPGVKLIGNLNNGWQPFVNVSFTWNLLDKTKVYANDVSLPEMSIDPYIKYGIGIRKMQGEYFTGFAQTYFTHGGRNGVGFQFGLAWVIGEQTKARITGAAAAATHTPSKKLRLLSKDN